MKRRCMTNLYTLAVVACGSYHAPGPITGGPDATIGCYRLSLEPWSPGSPLARISAPPSPPTIRLDLARRVTPPWAVFGSVSGSLPGIWRLVRKDSLVVQWTNANLGVTVSLRPAGDSLTGNATGWFEESGGVRETVNASATPIKCP